MPLFFALLACVTGDPQLTWDPAEGFVEYDFESNKCLRVKDTETSVLSVTHDGGPPVEVFGADPGLEDFDAEYVVIEDDGTRSWPDMPALAVVTGWMEAPVVLERGDSVELVWTASFACWEGDSPEPGEYPFELSWGPGLTYPVVLSIIWGGG